MFEIAVLIMIVTECLKLIFQRPRPGNNLSSAGVKIVGGKLGIAMLGLRFTGGVSKNAGAQQTPEELKFVVFVLSFENLMPYPWGLGLKL